MVNEITPALQSALSTVKREEHNPFVMEDSIMNRAKALFSYENPTEEEFPIDGRKLHKFLKVKTEYKDWSRRVIQDADMVQNQDYEKIKFRANLSETSDSKDLGGRPSINHKFSLNATKEIAMLQKSALGKLIRQYLIWAEEQLKKLVPTIDNLVNNPDLLITLATRLKEQQQALREKEETIQLLEPKAEIGEAVSSSPGSVSMRELAHLITQNGYPIGQNRLFTWMMINHYLFKRNNCYYPKQEYRERGIFNIQTRDIQNGDTRFLKSTVRITGKGVEYFLNIFKELSV